MVVGEGRRNYADEDTMLAVGEVHTGLLCHSSALTSREAADALGLAPGEPVRRSERPIAYAVSPNRLTGVDCALATLSGARTRAVGTVVSHASLTGGHILQGSSWARVLRGTAGRRLPWSHYLFRPGVVETVGRCDPDDIARGHAGAELPAGSLDLGAMSVRMMDAVEWRAGPDKRPPFRVWRTRLRWAAQLTADEDTEPQVRFTVEQGGIRTLSMTAGQDAFAHVV